MALTNQESADLMKDGVFQGRVKVACLRYAQYIFNENPGDPNTPAGYTGRYRWAQQTAQIPDDMAQKVQPLVVMDGAVQGTGAAIDDAALQSAVEGVVKKLF